MNLDRKSWLLVLFGGLFVLLLATFFLPSRNGSRSAPRVKSAANLRQIGQAILLYTKDFHGQYPDSFQAILVNEDITSSVFVSPLRSETPADGATTQAIAGQLDAGGHVSYVYLGRGLSTSTVTPNTVVAYELPANSGEGANILFGDGHVEFFDGAFVDNIIGKVSTGEFPVTMPSVP